MSIENPFEAIPKNSTEGGAEEIKIKEEGLTSEEREEFNKLQEELGVYGPKRQLMASPEERAKSVALKETFDSLTPEEQEAKRRRYAELKEKGVFISPKARLLGNRDRAT